MSYFFVVPSFTSSSRTFHITLSKSERVMQMNLNNVKPFSWRCFLTSVIEILVLSISFQLFLTLYHWQGSSQPLTKHSWRTPQRFYPQSRLLKLQQLLKERSSLPTLQNPSEQALLLWKSLLVHHLPGLWEHIAFQGNIPSLKRTRLPLFFRFCLAHRPRLKCQGGLYLMFTE